MTAKTETDDSATMLKQLEAKILNVLAPKWGWVLFSGALTLLFGVLAFLLPLPAVLITTILFGAYAFADGVLSIIVAFQKKDSPNDHFWPLFLRGALGLFTGIIVVTLPAVATISLVTFAWVMMSIWSIMGGIMEIAAAIRLRDEIKGEWILGISGLISLIVGVAIPVLLWRNPAAGLVTMGLLIGFYATLHGILEIALAIRLRKIANKDA